MRVFYQFDFDTLSRSVRKQLFKSVSNPDYLVYKEASADWAVYFFNSLLILFLGFLVWLAASADFGDPVKDTVWEDKGLIVWYAILFFGIVYAVHNIWQHLRLKKKFHFLPGRYLFPLAIVEATSDKIAIHDLAQMRKLEVTHHETNGRYSKTIFKFNFNNGSRKTLTMTNKNKAEIVLEKFNASQNTARDAFQNRDIHTLNGFDPFLELRKNKWQGAANDPAAPFTKKLLALLVDLKLPLLLAAIAISAMFWYGRNAASDKRMYLNAKEVKTEAAYTGYITHGKFHVEEMKAELPRVVFNEVQKKNSVTLLRGLKSRFPHSDIQPDVNEEIHVLYGRALQKFQAQAVKSDASMVAAMERLLKFAEEHDNPNVTVNFTRPTATELAQLDAFLQLRGSNLRGMKIIPAAKYFADDSASAREARIIAGVRAAFSTIFPNDVLAFSATRSKPPYPMLQIAYQIEPSGKVYTSEKQDDAFVGLVMRFQSAIVVPDVDQRWKFDLEVEPPDSFNVEFQTSSHDTNRRAPEGQVYAVMAERAFDKLASKINAAFFRPDSSVFIKQVGAKR